MRAVDNAVMEVSTLRVTDTGLRFGRDHTFARWLRLGIALGGWNWIPKRPGASRVRQFVALDPVPPGPSSLRRPFPAGSRRTPSCAEAESRKIAMPRWAVPVAGVAAGY